MRPTVSASGGGAARFLAATSGRGAGAFSERTSASATEAPKAMPSAGSPSKSGPPEKEAVVCFGGLAE